MIKMSKKLKELLKSKKFKLVTAINTALFTTTLLMSGQKAYADEAPKVEDANEGVVPMEQPVSSETVSTVNVEPISYSKSSSEPVVDTYETVASAPEMENAYVVESVQLTDEEMVQEIENVDMSSNEVVESTDSNVETTDEPEILESEVVTDDSDQIDDDATTNDTIETDTNTTDSEQNTESTDSENSDVADEEKDGIQSSTSKEDELQIVEGESQQNPESVQVPQKQEDKNGFTVIQTSDGSSVAIYSPDDAFSADELNHFIENFNKSGLSPIVISDGTNVKVIVVNPTEVGEPVYADLTEYGLGVIEITLDENGNYHVIPDGSVDVTVTTGYMTHSYANDIDPDTIPDDEHYKADEELEPKDEPKDEPKEEPKDEPKEEPKEEPKDEPKEEQKYEPKEEVISALPQTDDQLPYGELLAVAAISGLSLAGLRKLRNELGTATMATSRISKRR